MELLTYYFSLDTHKNGSQRTLQGFETGDTYARKLVISLTENDESYNMPLDNCAAVMYVKRPSQASPSINACTIEGNQIVYECDPTDFIEEGITKMQLKVVEGTIASPCRVIVSPRFDVEVWESLVDDSEAVDTQTYTALEDAVIRATMAYDARITSFEFDENLILTVTYGVANDYNDEKAYAVNDICYYDGKAWKCLQACTGETPEEGTYWTEVDLSYAKITYTTDAFKNKFDEIVADVTPTITVGTVTTGSPTSVTNVGTTLDAIFDFVLEKGEKGEDGADGKDGKDGKDGTDGQDGADGFSPIATVTKSGPVATITITDAIGTTTATVSDGASGDTVSWNQLQATGTKIATITINGNPVDVYAPTSGGGGGASSLAQLDDVTISSANDGQMLVYDSALTKWKNANQPTIPADLDDLSDVTITSASDGQALVYDNANSVWKNESLSIPSDLDDLSDITITSASDDDVLTYDNGEWVNKPLPSIPDDLADLSDVTITSASNGQVLTYSNGDWVNASPASGGHTIKNPSGTSMTARSNLQFLGSAVSVTDDSGNDVTKVTITGGSGLLPHIIVISEEQATVTAVKGGTTINFTETSTGHYEGDVTEYGTWTIHSVLGGDDATTTLNVDDCKVYTIDDSHFSASITVYYPNGGTCSCSMTGEQTLYANTCPYTFTVHAAGTWTISTTEYGETFTETVVITTDGQTETVSLPDGDTITPTDDVPALLACAGIGDSLDATLADLLADSATLLKVLTTDNAIDYLVRSTTFASAIVADEDAMKMIGSYDYASDTLLADSTWATAINGSTYASSVANLGVPQMTGNTTPSGECIASGIYDSTYDKYKAFDKNSATEWASASQHYQNQYVGYDFKRSGFKVFGFSIQNTPQAGVGSSYPFNDFKLQGYDTDWHDIQSYTNPSGTGVKTFFAVSTQNSNYSQYRIYGNAYGTALVSVAELAFLCREKGGVQSWLKAGGITDKAYTTLAEVLADSTTLSALLTSNPDAYDYLATAYGLVDGIVADATAMGYIGLDNYGANKLLSDEVWLNAICNSTYMESVLNAKVPVMTSNTTPSGEAFANDEYTYGSTYAAYKVFDGVISDSNYWRTNEGSSYFPAWVGYKFTSAVKVYKVTLASFMSGTSSVNTKDFKIQGSNNNSTWVDLGTYTNSNPSTTPQPFVISGNTTAYQYWRCYVTSNWASRELANISELQFYGRVDV